MSKLLINTSNLHVGGGVQVAVSFIDELSKSNNVLKLYDLWISTEVYENLRNINCDLSNFNSFKIKNFYGISSLFSLQVLIDVLFKYEIVFTLFGPFYVFFKPRRHIMGFAQPSIIYPEIALSMLPNFLVKFKFLLKLKIQELFFRNTDTLIVELDHVRTSLLKKSLFSRHNIFVVNNCFSSVFLNPILWDDVVFPPTKSIKIGYLGRNYTHKNLKILPTVLSVLKNFYNLDVKFYVTLTDHEFNLCSDDFKRNIINIGKLSVNQCPIYYQKLDGVIFPSLLECFSATPLESLIMGKPIFLSNRHFNSEITMNFGFYFDPLNPSDIARVINNYYSSTFNGYIDFESMKNHALNFSSAKNRMEEYIKILNL